MLRLFVNISSACRTAMNAVNSNQADVILFLSRELSLPTNRITLNLSLFHDLGVDGDDAFELLKTYALKFTVDISEFRFYDYFGPEGAPTPWGFILELLFRKQYKKKKRLTVEDLVRGVASGKLE